MRTLFALLAAFFAGLWLAEVRQKEDAKENTAQLKRIIDTLSAKVPEVKEVDRRRIYEVLPQANTDIENFDTKSSFIEYYTDLVRTGINMGLTPLQAKELGEDLISLTVTLAYWDEEQEMKVQE